jgi:hypothetical protein
MSLIEDSKIIVTDELDGLTCYHYDNANISSSDEIKQCRGIIKNGEEIICKTFGFTPEFGANDTENLKTYLEPMLSNPDVIMMPAFEGCLIRRFFHNDKWYTSTHKKIDAHTSKWGCDISFGELFVNAFLKFSDNKSFDYDFYNNKDCVYVYLLKNCIGNRIVCVAGENPELQFIVRINKNDDTYDFHNAYTSVLTNDNPITLEHINEMVSNIDITTSQGLMFINTKTLESIKVIKDDYIFYAMLRGNQPNLLYRYIELQQSDEPKNVEYFYNLYPEKQSDFNDFHKVIDDVCINVYRKYRNRYVRKQISIAPQDQFYIMKELHELFINSNKIDIITQERVKTYIYSLPTARLLYIYNQYVSRRSVTGNGNKVTTDDKEKIVSCIYKDDLIE